MAFDFKSAKPSQLAAQPQSTGFDFKSAKPSVPTTSSTNQPSAIASNPLTGSITSAIGGIASGAADVIQGINDTPVYIMEHLNIISPETAKKIYNINKENVAIFRPESQNDIFGQAQSNYPLPGQVTKSAVDIYALAKAGKLLPMLTQGLPKVAGLAARAMGMGTISQAGADPENKDTAFVTGMALQPVGELLGKGIQFGASKAKATTLKLLQNMAKKGDSLTPKIDKFYDQVKLTPFTSEDQGKAYQLGIKIKDFIDNTPTLDSTQRGTFNHIANKLINAQSHAQTLTYLKQLAAKDKAFVGTKASPDLFQFFKNTKQELANIITSATNRTQETINALKKADNLVTQQKIIQSSLKNILDDPELFNKTSAIKTLNTYLKTFKNKPDSKIYKTIAGIKELIKQIPSDDRATKISPYIAASGVGMSAGSYYGYQKGGVIGGAIGGALGLMGGSIATKALANYLQTQKGIDLIASFGTKATNSQDAANFLKAIVAGSMNAVGNINNNEESLPPIGPTSLNDTQPIIPGYMRIPTNNKPPPSQVPPTSLFS